MTTSSVRLGLVLVVSLCGFTTYCNARAIPEWRLNAARNGGFVTKSLRDKAGFPAMQAANGGPTELPRTVAQDDNRCGLPKLSENVILPLSSSSFFYRRGVWQTPQGGELAQWSQNFFSSDPQTLHLDAAAGAHPSVRAELRTNEEMNTLYNWKPLPSAGDNVTIALTDCDGELLFVLREVNNAFPVYMEIYRRDGILVGTTLVDPDRPVVRFVDTEMRLLATAESPGIGANLTMLAMKDVPSDGGIYPWGIRYELGGYDNSSQLLDEDYRWVVAVAVQVRALRDAMRAQHNTDTSFFTGRAWYMLSMGLMLVLCIGLLLGMLFFIFRLVYPLAIKTECSNPFLQFPPRTTNAGSPVYRGQSLRLS